MTKFQMENQKGTQDNRLRCEMQAEDCQHVFDPCTEQRKTAWTYKEATLSTGSS